MQSLYQNRPKLCQFRFGKSEAVMAASQKQCLGLPSFRCVSVVKQRWPTMAIPSKSILRKKKCRFTAHSTLGSSIDRPIVSAQIDSPSAAPQSHNIALRADLTKELQFPLRFQNTTKHHFRTGKKDRHLPLDSQKCPKADTSSVTAYGQHNHRSPDASPAPVHPASARHRATEPPRMPAPATILSNGPIISRLNIKNNKNFFFTLF